ncbi:Homeodomain, phBC6A51-type [uncultured Caudovirales phage]|uniref:Homeodomain, phBC6A51-type n=1 Tax=uncultured Caudovirales phage TaxID=2100421 RepID=A0A6J5MWC6_9CAUD|nr:Homeodomain, phBC6A51-type [uncultured Caudovirales phage]
MESSHLDERQEKYLNWLLIPSQLREPSTQEAYAKQEGVDTTTLRRWQKKPYFKEEWAKRVEDLQGSPERTQKLMDTIYQRALGGDNKAAQLYLQATNRLAPQQVSITHSTPLAEISDKDLEELIASVATSEQTSRLQSSVKPD